jgi:TRAP transporter TAXI family solute receptor
MTAINMSVIVLFALSDRKTESLMRLVNHAVGLSMLGLMWSVGPALSGSVQTVPAAAVGSDLGQFAHVQSLGMMQLAQASSRVGGALPRHSMQAVPESTDDTKHQKVKEQINGGAVSIISGGIAGTYIRFAADMASVLDDGNNLRILPIIGKGSVQNIMDVLFMRGVDLGIVGSDSVEKMRRDGTAPNAQQQLSYITRLYNEEVHILTRTDITDISQLAGKKVNFDLATSGTAFTAGLIFDRLGVHPEVVNFDQNLSYEQLKSGEIDATVFTGGKPLKGIADFKNDGGKFHLLTVPFDSRLQDLYVPARIESSDYPSLIEPGKAVDTIGIAAILVVYNWPEGSERYTKVARFVDAFFSKFDEFQKPARHPKWREVNINGTIPGWSRFKPAQEWLDRAATGAIAQTPGPEDLKRFLDNRSKSALSDVEKHRLYQAFLEWSHKQRGQ